MYWDSKNQQLIRIPDQPYDGSIGWILKDCHCCLGLQWGTGYECKDCAGGAYAFHVQSGVMAMYPGGPFLGRRRGGG